MTHLVSAPRSPQLQRNEILDVSPPFEVQLWGWLIEAIEVKFKRPGGVEEVALGMDTHALAAVLEYANGSKGVRNIIRRNRDRFERWSLQPNKIAGARIEPPHNERLYVYGPGLDLVAVLSSQPKAADFQDWLAERSYELRTRGWSAATPEITQAIEERLPAPGADKGNPLDLFENALSVFREHEQRIAAITQEQATVKAKTSELDAKTLELAQRVEKIEKEREVDQLKPGECSLTTLASRAGWYSYASGGTLAYGDGILLAMLNAGFDERFFLRRITTSIEAGETLRSVKQWVVTPEGVQEFFGEVNPLYPRIGEFKISPNSAARRAGKHRSAHIIKGRVS